MNRVCLLLVLVLGSWLCAHGVSAAPTSEATQACVDASTTGQMERDEGRLLAAREQLLECAREACPSIVKKSCASWLAELGERIPSVVVRVLEAGARDITDARVALDGGPVALDGRPVALDPGKHTLSVDVQGWPPVERTFLVAEREQGRLLVVELPAREAAHVRAEPRSSNATARELRLDEPLGARARPSLEPSAPATRAAFSVPRAAWVLGGLGVVGIVSFVALRSKAARDLDRLLRTCSPDCSERERDAGNRKTLAADVSLGIGVATLAGAGAWTLGSWLVDSRRAPLRAGIASLSLRPERGGAFAAVAAHY